MNNIILLIISTIKYSNCYTVKQIKKECGFKDNTYLSAISIGIDQGLFNSSSKLISTSVNSTDIIILSFKGERLLSTLDNIIDLTI